MWAAAAVTPNAAYATSDRQAVRQVQWAIGSPRLSSAIFRRATGALGAVLICQKGGDAIRSVSVE
jgi:hypothetical protein